MLFGFQQILKKISFVIFDIVVRLVSPQQILTAVMTCIVVDKSTDHAKPHSIC